MRPLYDTLAGLHRKKRAVYDEANNVRMDATPEAHEALIHALLNAADGLIDRAHALGNLRWATRQAVVELERLNVIYGEVVMDTPEDRDLHARAMKRARESVQAIRSLLESTAMAGDEQ